MKTLLTLIFAVITITLHAETADSLTVWGKAVDSKSNPVPFTNVVLLNADSAFVLGGTTDTNGVFNLKCPKHGVAFLRLSCIGYKTLTVHLAANGNMGTLAMENENLVIGEVTIKGQRPVHQLRKGGILTNVRGTTMEILGNALDVIAKLPGVRREDDNIKVFGKGTPAIYINGRKLTDQSELARLSSKDIENVEVINNPGSKYDAEVKSVLLIRTVKKHGEGWSGSVQAVARAAHSVSQSDNVSLNYRKNGIDVFGAFDFNYSNRYQKQNNATTINTGKDIYLLNSDLIIKPVSTNYFAKLGFNWQVNEKNVFGARYEFQATPHARSNWFTNEKVTRNNELTDKIDYQTHWRINNTPTNSLNMYYIGTFGNLSLTVNNDYYSSRNRAAQTISQNSMTDGESTVRSNNRIKSSMLASKAVAEYKLGKSTLEGGYEYTNTDRTDRYYNISGLLPDADDNIKEQTIAGFVSATFPIGAFELSGGLRYEHTVSDYYQSGKFVPGQSRKYDRLFPNIDFTFPIKAARFTLSYTAKTRRPMYSQLGSNIQYDDRYTYETGNPLLQPEINHDITLSGVYKWIYFSASYQYKKNAIVGIVEPYEEGKPINLMTYRNYDNLSNYSATLSFSPKISQWSPELQFDLVGQDFDISTIGGRRSMNSPLFFVSFDNGLSFGKGFTATGGISWHSKGDMDVVTLKPSWQVDLGITKTQGNWYFQLSATDIFKTARNSMITYGTQMSLNKWNYSDSQAVRLTVRYSFNATTNKYKGGGAGQAEKNRL